MDTKISLCMIVKDEAQNIRRCLESVAGAVDELIVVDTGSNDNTCEIAREFGALVHTFLWNENFSDARNASLELATGDWILFLDADEELAKESQEVIRKLTADDTVEGYFIKIINYLGNDGWVDSCPDLVFRLFRNRPEYRFRGAIHEQIADVILEKNNKACYRIAEEIVIIHYGYLDKQIDEKDKKNRNLKIIQRELELNPKNSLLRYHYGVELFRAERYAEAAQELTQAANSIDPSTIFFPKLLRYIVMSYQSAGQSEKALEVAQLTLQFFPDYADIYYYSGLLCLDLRQYGKANDFFQKAVSMPEQPAQYASFNGIRGFRSYYHLGQIAEFFLKDEEALKFYIASLRDNHEFIPALENIVRILNPRENPEYTVECLGKILDFCTPRANLIMGDIYYRQGAYGLALEYLNKGTKNEPFSPEKDILKAICLIQERRYLEALKIIDNFTPESNHYPLAKLNKVLCFWIQGQKKKARSLIMELCALGLSEDTENVLSLLFEALDKRKKNLAITLGQDGMNLLLDIIKRLLYMDEIDRALNLLSLIKSKDLAKYNGKIGQMFYEYGYKDEAETFLRKYLTSHQNEDIHFLLAEIYQENGNYIEAEQHYRHAIELNPDEPRYYIRKINLYEKMRKEILQEAIQKHPDSKVFKELLKEEPDS